MKVYVYTRATHSNDDGWVNVAETHIFTNPEDALELFNKVRRIWTDDEDENWYEDWNTYGCGDRDEYSAHYSCNNDCGDTMTQSVTTHEI